MKRLLPMLFCLSVLLCILSINVQAIEPNNFASEYSSREILISREVHEFPDGSSCLITVTQVLREEDGSRSIVTGSKTYSLRNEDGDVLWTFTIHGTFLVNVGVSAACSSAYYTYEIVDDDWSFVSGTASRNGNQAVGHGEFNRKFLFIVVETKTCDVTLTCSINGALS